MESLVLSRIQSPVSKPLRVCMKKQTSPDSYQQQLKHENFPGIPQQWETQKLSVCPSNSYPNPTIAKAPSFSSALEKKEPANTDSLSLRPNEIVEHKEAEHACPASFFISRIRLSTSYSNSFIQKQKQRTDGYSHFFSV